MASFELNKSNVMSLKIQIYVLKNTDLSIVIRISKVCEISGDKEMSHTFQYLKEKEREKKQLTVLCLILVRARFNVSDVISQKGFGQGIFISSFLRFSIVVIFVRLSTFKFLISLENIFQ